jgi:two-component system, OmpR family, response regulator
VSGPRPLRKILVVDDEPDLRTIAHLALRAVGGFEVAECASGTEAIARLDELGPDLVLLDVMMPGTDGPTTLAELRARAGPRAPVVVFLTARAQLDEVARYEAMGAAGVITKPFDPMGLAGEVRRLWERARPQESPPAPVPPPSPDAADRCVATVAARFVASLPEVARELDAAVARGASDEALRIAHRLRGTAGTLKLAALAAAAGSLEDALASGRPLASLEPEIAGLRERLRGAV